MAGQRCRAAADEADDGAAPGLLLKLTDGRTGEFVERVVSSMTIPGGMSGPADLRMPSFTKAEWSGTLLVREPAVYTFHADISGALRIEVGGVTVLDAQSGSGVVSGRPTMLAAGEHSLSVVLRADRTRSDSPACSLCVFWSAPGITLEPLPPDSLWHSSDDAVAANATAGQLLADSRRCAACHQDLAAVSPPVVRGPDLRVSAAHLSSSDIVHQLRQRDAGSGRSMPVYELSDGQAKDIAAFLLATAQEPEPLPKCPDAKPDDAEAGSRLLLTLGCAACHEDVAPSSVESSRPWAAPPLKSAATRRSPDWLYAWLKDPESLAPAHRMPVFNLSDDERRQLVVALKSLQSESVAVGVAFTEPGGERRAPDGAAVARGKELVAEARCAACHSMGDPRAMRPDPVPELSAEIQSDPAECLARPSNSEASGKVSMRFALTESERAQLLAWLKSLPQERERPRQTSGMTSGVARGPEYGRMLMHRNGCLACHDRDFSRGLSQHAAVIASQRDDLRGQSQALIPPSLTAVGDKLNDEVLRQAVAGEQSQRRLPWLLVRMPKFRLSDEERSAVVGHLILSDRIPDALDAARGDLFSHFDPRQPLQASADDLLHGNLLAGATGLNCTACHSAGGFEPRNVALGTRGSDLMQMGQRIRSRYFLRWMRNPIRVLPGTEMPQLRKPAAGLPGESLDEQMAILWRALSDPRFEPPTVLSRYERVVSVPPDGPPVVIRDVFTLPESNRGDDPPTRRSVARAFAVGFPNGHNVLLDLDSMQVVQWTAGEFARQRTEGKSWFWDLGGSPVDSPPDLGPFCELLMADGRTLLQPVRDQLRTAELRSWSQHDDRVELLVRFHFPASSGQKLIPDEARAAHAVETAWSDPSQPLMTADLRVTLSAWTRDAEVGSGWSMTVEAVSLPADSKLRISSWWSGHSERPMSVMRTAVDPRGHTVFGDSPVLRAGEAVELRHQTSMKVTVPVAPPLPPLIGSADSITTLPGFHGHRLPLPQSIMPTALARLSDGRLAFTSLRGDVHIARDSDNDGLEDSLTTFASGLAAPYGLLADPQSPPTADPPAGMSLLVAHKPEILRLRDRDGDDVADDFEVVASGWGYSDDYHDWTTGLIRDSEGRLLAGLGSDYSQSRRDPLNDRWRGTVVRVDRDGQVTPLAYSFRFPMGLAIDGAGRLFVTDNQGVQNPFNEINHIVPGRHYGVPSRHETARKIEHLPATLMVPHPWTRSVNAITFLPADYPMADLAGHGIGCEYDTRCLIRFTTQQVGETVQGAVYRFSLPGQPVGGSNFMGPVSCLVEQDGTLVIGSIQDSGWQGGANTGSIEVLRPNGELPNGIREITATVDGFDVQFFHPVEAGPATDAASWSVQAWTRIWSGNYATEDSDRHTLIPDRIELSDDRRTVRLIIRGRKAGYLHEISAAGPLDAGGRLWPAEGYYSLHEVPQ